MGSGRSRNELILTVMVRVWDSGQPPGLCGRARPRSAANQPPRPGRRCRAWNMNLASDIMIVAAFKLHVRGSGT